MLVEWWWATMWFIIITVVFCCKVFDILSLCVDIDPSFVLCCPFDFERNISSIITPEGSKIIQIKHLKHKTTQQYIQVKTIKAPLKHHIKVHVITDEAKLHHSHHHVQNHVIYPIFFLFLLPLVTFSNFMQKSMINQPMFPLPNIYPSPFTF